MLDGKSQFIKLYPFLLVRRDVAHQNPESLLIVSLDAKEAVDASAKTAKAFLAVIARQNEDAIKALVPVG